METPTGAVFKIPGWFIGIPLFNDYQPPQYTKVVVYNPPTNQSNQPSIIRYISTNIPILMVKFHIDGYIPYYAHHVSYITGAFPKRSSVMPVESRHGTGFGQQSPSPRRPLELATWLA